MKTKSKTIIITSNESWGDVWFSKQHYANELSKLGHTVYFLNAPTHWHFFHLFSLAVRTEEINENLIVINYHNNFPIRIFKRFFLKLNDLINSWKIAKLVNGKENIIWWQFDPFRFIDIYFFSNPKRIYHVTDPFLTISTDKLIAKKANLVVLLLKRYHDYYLSLNKNTIIIPHGIGDDEYKTDERQITEYQKKYAAPLLFIGTINDHYNIELLCSIANQFPKNTLLLIGPLELTNKNKVSSFQNLLQKDNVKWMGAQKASGLKNYIASASVCIVPYDFGMENEKGSSIKILHYLAQQKITVTSIKTGFESLLNKGVYFAENEKEFLNFLSKALAGELSFSTLEINDHLKSINYIELIDSILKELNHTPE